MAFKDIIVSGTRPTGNLHLGNYLGAVKNFVAMQEGDTPAFFFIADLHSLTTHPHPAHLLENVRTVLIEYLATGLDPAKITVYRQSDVPEVTELYLLFNMLAPVGELQKTTTFKDKVRQHPDNVNAGLLTYPTLMAADILLHKATLVPVGEDQTQHIEMTRNYAQRFNRIYEREVFPEPVAYNMGAKPVRVPGLNGAGKMSKSEDAGAAIFLNDSPKDIEKKIKRAVTDAGPVKGEPMGKGVENLFTLMEYVSRAEDIATLRSQFEDATLRYGDLKKQLYTDMIAYLAPIRERIEQLNGDNDYLNDVLAAGARAARQSAAAVMNETREAVGLSRIY